MERFPETARALLRRLRPGLLSSLAAAAGFALLAFPLVAVRVDTVEHTIRWRWGALAGIAAAAFVLSALWRRWQRGRAAGPAGPDPAAGGGRPRSAAAALAARPAFRRTVFLAAAAVALAFPWRVSSYQVTIVASALIYVVLGLGLNVVVGLAGLLNLGYAAFYAVGAYTYALLNQRFGVGFWAALPLGGLLAAGFGILLGFPVLRLRGDYLAIVTLGFGEIVRIVLENWTGFSGGTAGIAGIPRPGFFGAELSLDASTVLVYHVALALALATVVATGRLQASRVGRAWLALREDETAAAAMGVDPTWTKLSAFALGAFFAGTAGVVFAARTTYINPASFTFLESAMVLSIVVFGGLASTAGIVVAALALVLLPEYLRAFSQYRMLIFGAALVLMVVFRPQGLGFGTLRRRADDAEAGDGG